MKKLISLFAAAAMIFAGTAPANADVTYFDDWQWWNNVLQPTTAASLSFSGSLQEGGTYRVTASGTAQDGCYIMIKELANSTVVKSFSSTGSTFSFETDLLTAGAAGTSASYGLHIGCTNEHARYMTLNFETSVGTPTNFSVFPQAAGTAFTTWGIADGATSYVVTAAPGNHTCATTDNFCIVSGLTAGETYNFSLAARNGNATGTAVSSGPIALREPVVVAVALNGGTWKAGETITAQYALQGSNASPAITWYRCAAVVGAMPTPPSANDCSSVGSGASYALTAGDVGKFVTAHVFVNNTDPQGQMTASSNTAVLASGAVAPAPVADPAGKPTIVNIPNPIVSVAGGTQVTITGTGLAGVTSVTIGGVPAIVISKTDTTVVVQVPNATKVGLADLTVTNSKGSATSKSAIVYTTNPVLKITKTKSITGFKASSKTLTTAQKSAVKTLISANPTLTQLSCAAKTVGVAVSKSELAKAKSLATATCAYAKTLKKTLVTSATASQTLPKAKASRTVLLTLKN